MVVEEPVRLASVLTPSKSVIFSTITIYVFLKIASLFSKDKDNADIAIVTYRVTNPVSLLFKLG